MILGHVRGITFELRNLTKSGQNCPNIFSSRFLVRSIVLMILIGRNMFWFDPDSIYMKENHKIIHFEKIQK